MITRAKYKYNMCQYGHLFSTFNYSYYYDHLLSAPNRNTRTRASMVSFIYFLLFPTVQTK